MDYPCAVNFLKHKVEGVLSLQSESRIANSPISTVNYIKPANKNKDLGLENISDEGVIRRNNLVLEQVMVRVIE
jgi:hypothetical protein